MACLGSLPSSCVEKHPDPKSDQEVDPHKHYVLYPVGETKLI